jgi:hypothetical protein
MAIPCNAGEIVHKGFPCPGDTVKKGRFPYIGTTYYGDNRFHGNRMSRNFSIQNPVSTFF